MGTWYSNGPRCPSLCLAHANISEIKQDRYMVTKKLDVFGVFGAAFAKLLWPPVMIIILFTMCPQKTATQV